MAVPLGVVQTIVPTFFWCKALPLGAPRTILTTLPLADATAARDRLAAYGAAGASHVIHGARYADASAFRTMLDQLVRAAGG